MLNDKVLVLGGAGFIGSHLSAALLNRGLGVRVFDSLSPQVHGAVPEGLDWLNKDGIEFQRGSISRKDDVLAALDGVDSIVHLAAETGTGQSMYEIARYNEVNSQGTALLLDALANNPRHRVKRVVLASSRAVYGEGAYVCSGCNRGGRLFPNPRSLQKLAAHEWEFTCVECGAVLTPIPTSETDPVQPASVYAATKYAQEDLVRVVCRSLGIGFGILRLQNVYGEGQSLKNPYTGILSIWSTRVRAGLELSVFEDGLVTRDFVHVEDVTGAIVECLKLDKSPDCVINVGSGVATTIDQVAQRLSRAMGASPKTRVTREYRIGDIRHNVADISRLKGVLNYEPRISFADGIARFSEWALAQPLHEDRVGKANEALRTRNLMG